MKKKVPERKAPSHHPIQHGIEQFLKKLERENQMIDDHGHTIVGRRDRRPNLDEDSE